MRLGLPPWPGRGRASDSFPIEEYRDGVRYVVRAELPGLDPAKEIAVMVADNDVSIEVSRPVRLRGPANGQFHYGPVRRTVRLPRGAKDETVTATYGADGILEIVVELTKPVPIGRMVPIRRASRARKRNR